MKETPILFKPEMIRAIFEDRKNQTRRTNGLKRLNQEPDLWYFGGINKFGEYIFYPTAEGEKKYPDNYPDDFRGLFKCPYGCKGDLLWVREGYCEYGSGVIYKRDYGKHSPISDGIGGPWKSPVFMFKKYARLWLELTADPKPQRLQEISRADAHAEGFEPGMNGLESWNGKCYGNAELAFKACIESINGPGTWEKNPWVWKMEFKRHDLKN